MNQDKTRAVTLEDLIRRYDLENLKSERKVIKTMATTIENQHTIIKQFIKNTYKYSNDQAKLTAWFFSGPPTLTNEPFSSLLDKQKQEEDHLYYDRDTGLVYRLENDGGYKWTLIEDDSLAQSMAIANSDPDSQDNRRNIFYETPTPPYAVGDIWIDNNIIMRCRCSRDGDSFKDTEWVEQKYYSESNVLLDVRAVLDSFIENVEKNYITTSRLETTKNTIEAEITSKLEGVADDDGFVTVASLILAINGAESSAKIKADKIALSATDILNLIAGNEINLTSRNITIKSDNFSATKDGTVTANKLKATNVEISGTISGSKISGTDINAGTIKGSEISGGSIKGTNIEGNNITGGTLHLISDKGNDIFIIENSAHTKRLEITGNGIYYYTSDDGKYWWSASHIDFRETQVDITGITEKNAIATGTCQLNQTDTTVYFNKSFGVAPIVLLQCIEPTSDVTYVAHIASVTDTYFKAYIPILGLNEYKNFYWIAIA